MQPWHSQAVPGFVMELPLCPGHVAGSGPFLTALGAGARAAVEPHPPHSIFLKLRSQEMGKHVFQGAGGQRGFEQGHDPSHDGSM